MKAMKGRDLDKVDQKNKKYTVRRHQRSIIKANEKWLNREPIKHEIKKHHPWKDLNKETD